MRLGRTAIAAGLLALVLPAIGAAQGLGDAAARERAKREKARGRKAEPARLITNEDLESGRPAGEKPEGGASASSAPGVAEAPAESAPAESAPASSSPFEDRNAALRPYLDGVTQAQARLDEVEARIRELGGKLNPMSTTYIYGAVGSNSLTEEAEVRQQLQEAEGQLGEARQGLAAASEALQGARQGRAVSPPTEPR